MSAKCRKRVQPSQSWTTNAHRNCDQLNAIAIVECRRIAMVHQLAKSSTQFGCGAAKIYLHCKIYLSKRNETKAAAVNLLNERGQMTKDKKRHVADWLPDWLKSLLGEIVRYLALEILIPRVSPTALCGWMRTWPPTTCHLWT
uniref:Transposase n=1 Tax=Ascaris lumbricoides TaxID=6252 RepID=A0A0M3HTX8_ASCLU